MDSIKNEPMTPNGGMPTVNANELPTQVNTPVVKISEPPIKSDDTPSDPQAPADMLTDNTMTHIPAVPRMQPSNEIVPQPIPKSNQTPTTTDVKDNFLQRLLKRLH